MDNILHGVYSTIAGRRQAPQEGSYTAYLFEQGLDKILKKCGEECSEVLIAAKNRENDKTADELADLLYHLMVLMVEQGITWDQVESVLEKRHAKQGNLKTFHATDKNT